MKGKKRLEERVSQGSLRVEFENFSLGLAKRYQLTRSEALHAYRSFVNSASYLKGHGLPERLDPIRSYLRKLKR